VCFIYFFFLRYLLWNPSMPSSINFLAILAFHLVLILCVFSYLIINVYSFSFLFSSFYISWRNIKTTGEKESFLNKIYLFFMKPLFYYKNLGDTYDWAPFFLKRFYIFFFYNMALFLLAVKYTLVESKKGIILVVFFYFGLLSPWHPLMPHLFNIWPGFLDLSTFFLIIVICILCFLFICYGLIFFTYWLFILTELKFKLKYSNGLVFFHMLLIGFSLQLILLIFSFFFYLLGLEILLIYVKVVAKAFLLEWSIAEHVGEEELEALKDFSEKLSLLHFKTFHSFFTNSNRKRLLFYRDFYYFFYHTRGFPRDWHLDMKEFTYKQKDDEERFMPQPYHSVWFLLKILIHYFDQRRKK
jgi:hypothetical protein